MGTATSIREIMRVMAEDGGWMTAAEIKERGRGLSSYTIYAWIDALVDTGQVERLAAGECPCCLRAMNRYRITAAGLAGVQ